MPGRPDVLVVKGRHPGVTGNSTREIGGVRTATVIATPAQTVDRTMLAVVEEVFHVFWLARHPSFRPNELARYVYPLDDANNLRALLAEDEALARALEAQRIDDAAGWWLPRSGSAGNASRGWRKTFVSTRRRWR